MIQMPHYAPSGARVFTARRGVLVWYETVRCGLIKCRIQHVGQGKSDMVFLLKVTEDAAARGYRRGMTFGAVGVLHVIPRARGMIRTKRGSFGRTKFIAPYVWAVEEKED